MTKKKPSVPKPHKPIENDRSGVITNQKEKTGGK
tara:strand:+ start:42 stop:143 length:102 start_codon:yes stop_codon:yes gene_type:complete